MNKFLQYTFTIFLLATVNHVWASEYGSAQVNTYCSTARAQAEMILAIANAQDGKPFYEEIQEQRFLWKDTPVTLQYKLSCNIPNGYQEKVIQVLADNRTIQRQLSKNNLKSVLILVSSADEITVMTSGESSDDGSVFTIPFESALPLNEYLN